MEREKRRQFMEMMWAVKNAERLIGNESKDIKDLLSNLFDGFCMCEFDVDAYGEYLYKNRVKVNSCLSELKNILYKNMLRLKGKNKSAEKNRWNSAVQEYQKMIFYWDGFYENEF